MSGPNHSQNSKNETRTLGDPCLEEGSNLEVQSTKQHTTAIRLRKRANTRDSESEHPTKTRSRLLRRSEISKTLEDPKMDKSRRRSIVNKKRALSMEEGCIVQLPERKKQRVVDERVAVDLLRKSKRPCTGTRSSEAVHRRSVENRAVKQGPELKKTVLNATPRHTMMAPVSSSNFCTAVAVRSSDSDVEENCDIEYSDGTYERIKKREMWVDRSSSLCTRLNGVVGTDPSDFESVHVQDQELRTESDEEHQTDDDDDDDCELEDIPEANELMEGGGVEHDVVNSNQIRERDDSFLLNVEEANEFEEGERNFEDNSDFEGEEDPLLKSILSQKERRARATPPRRSAVAAVSFLANSKSPLRIVSGTLGNMKEEWEIEYQRKPLSFFNSSEARLEVDQKVLRLATGQVRASSYTGIKVNETNNSDIEFIYTRAFKSTSRSERSHQQTYSNFLTCIGQVARAGIALKKLSLHNLWKPGELFKIADNPSFFHLFVNHFACTSTPTTISNKEAQLVKFVDFAISYWNLHPRHPGNAEKNNAMQVKMTGVTSFLRHDRSINKTAARRIRQKTKEDWHRASAGKFISEEMFELMRGVAADALKGIIRTVFNRFQEKGARDAAQKREVFADLMLKKWNLLKKWSVNFLALLLVYGNGQRNQVYTFLKCPTIADMLVFRQEHGGIKASTPLQIPIHEDEKRIRDSRMPFIMLDPLVFDYVNFHVTFVHPFIMNKYNVEEGTPGSSKLLLDTRNGRPISSNNVRHSLSSWIRTIDPELNITPMDLRSSYATIMMRRHAQRGQAGTENNFAFQNLTEDEFLSMLAGVMNTGVEQLRQVYSASSHANYALNVARVMNICSKNDSILAACEGYGQLID